MKYRGLKETMIANITPRNDFMYVMKDHITKDDLLPYQESADTQEAFTFVAENAVMCCGTTSVGALSLDKMYITLAPNMALDGLVGNQVKYDSFTIFEPTGATSGVTRILNNVLIYSNVLSPGTRSSKNSSGTNIIQFSETEIASGGPISVSSLRENNLYYSRNDMHPSSSSASCNNTMARVLRNSGGTYSTSGCVHEIRYFEEIETDIFFIWFTLTNTNYVSSSLANTRLRMCYYDEAAGTWVYLINRAYIADSKLCGYKFPKVKASRFRFVADSTLGCGANSNNYLYFNKVGFGLQDSTYVNKTLNPKVAVVVGLRRPPLSGAEVVYKFGQGLPTERYILSTGSGGEIEFTNPFIEGNKSRLRTKSLPIGEDL